MSIFNRLVFKNLNPAAVRRFDPGLGLVDHKLLAQTEPSFENLMELLVKSQGILSTEDILLAEGELRRSSLATIMAIWNEIEDSKSFHDRINTFHKIMLPHARRAMDIGGSCRFRHGKPYTGYPILGQTYYRANANMISTRSPIRKGSIIFALSSALLEHGAQDVLVEVDGNAHTRRWAIMFPDEVTRV